VSRSGSAPRRVSLSAEGFCLNGQLGAPIRQAEGDHHAAGRRCRQRRKISRAAARLARDPIRDDIGFAWLDHANRCQREPPWRPHNANPGSDSDGGGVAVPQCEGTEPITRCNVPPSAIWPWRNQAVFSGLPLSVADCT
jgi:hypothetical protein